MTQFIENTNLTINPKTGSNLGIKIPLASAATALSSNLLLYNNNSDGSIDMAIQTTFENNASLQSSVVIQVIELDDTANFTNQALDVTEDVQEAFIIHLDNTSEKHRILLCYIVDGTGSGHNFTTNTITCGPNTAFSLFTGVPTGTIIQEFPIIITNVTHNSTSGSFPNGSPPGTKTIKPLWIHVPNA